MKRNDDVRILLFSLFFNILLSYFYGNKYKTDLLNILSEQIYYQLLVFLSLCIPLMIKRVYFLLRKKIVANKVRKFQSSASDLENSRLDEDTKKMLISIVDNEMATAQSIKELYSEIQEMYGAK